jgi:hypothetical protein
MQAPVFGPPEGNAAPYEDTFFDDFFPYDSVSREEFEDVFGSHHETLTFQAAVSAPASAVATHHSNKAPAATGPKRAESTTASVKTAETNKRRLPVRAASSRLAATIAAVQEGPGGDTSPSEDEATASRHAAKRARVGSDNKMPRRSATETMAAKAAAGKAVPAEGDDDDESSGAESSTIDGAPSGRRRGKRDSSERVARR